MNTYLSRTLFGLLILMFSSCTTLYVPNMVNMPLLSEKGDLKVNAGIGRAKNLQAAYALTDHFAIMANGMYFGYNKNHRIMYDDTTVTGVVGDRSQFLEFGGGYFTQLDKSWRFEAYGGMGMGSSFSNKGSLDPFYHPKTVINYYRYFIQPGIGYTSKNVEFATGIRLTDIDFYDLFSESDYLNHRTFEMLMAEPMLTVSLGIRNAKVWMQTGAYIPLTMAEQYHIINSDPFLSLITLRFGVNMSFNLLPPKK